MRLGFGQRFEMKVPNKHCNIVIWYEIFYA